MSPARENADQNLSSRSSTRDQIADKSRSYRVITQDMFKVVMEFRYRASVGIVIQVLPSPPRIPAYAPALGPKGSPGEPDDGLAG
ncbi:hypothetical protein LY76DRAFT_586824 [Colletotrichum caudatum]|nr:hypothetical protein LY76DRAFT_586824 [Colletotrichum caudatum]